MAPTSAFVLLEVIKLSKNSKKLVRAVKKPSQNSSIHPNISLLFKSLLVIETYERYLIGNSVSKHVTISSKVLKHSICNAQLLLLVSQSDLSFNWSNRHVMREFSSLPH